MQKNISRNFIKLLITSLIVAAFGGVAFAVNASPIITPADPEQSTTMSQRLTERKNQFKVQLDTTQQQNIKSKCVAAQGGLKDIKTKDAASAANRQQVYMDLATQLASIIDRLKRSGIDTTQLAATQKRFDEAVNTYLADAVVYKTAMDDVVALNCASDPVGFEADLLEARQFRAQLSSDAAKIKVSRPELTTELRIAQGALDNAPKAAQ